MSKVVNTNNETKTISFRLGKALLDAKTLNGLIDLPFKLIALRKEVLAKREDQKIFHEYQRVLDTLPSKRVLSQLYAKGQIEEVISFLNWYGLSNFEKANFIFENAIDVGEQDKKLGFVFLQLAIKYDRSEKILRAYAWAALHIKSEEKLSEAITLLKEQGHLLKDDLYLKTAELFEKKREKVFSNKNKIAANDDSKLITSPISYSSNEFDKNILDYYYSLGAEKLIKKIKNDFKGLDKTELAYTLVKAGKVLAAEKPELEVIFCEEALNISKHEKILRAALWAFQRSKRFDDTATVIKKLVPILNKSTKPKDKELLEKIYKAPAYNLLVKNFIVKEPNKKVEPIKNRIVYVLHNSFPYSSGGYATRAFGICDGLKQHGYDVVVVNRPGFPLDIKPELTKEDVSLTEVISGFEYVRTLEPSRKGLTAYEYMIRAADSLEKRFEEYKPEFVIAASNHITAIPSLIAAKRLGIPFIYEVRGFWEITRVSREPEFEETASFAVQVLLESMAAQYADYVFTLTQPMLDELINRGVRKEKVSLLPNSCTPEDFTPKNRNRNLARKLHIPADVPVIGYIGTFVQYEGLDDLAEACAILKQKGIKFRLLLVGNENASGTDRGPITQKIIDIATQYDFNEWLIMPGRVPHEEVENYYSLIDIAPFPRKPQPVCEMVSPMKPLEASAMKKAIIVSSVKALTEMIVDGETGLVFQKGNTKDMADKLETLLNDKALRKQLGEGGRKWVESERTWLKTTSELSKELIKLNQERV